MRSQTLMHRYERKLENCFSLPNHKREHEFDFISVSSQSAQGCGCSGLDLKCYLGGIEAKLA